MIQLRPLSRLPLLAAFVLGGCVPVVWAPVPQPDTSVALSAASVPVPISTAAATFVAVADRVEPVAEAICRRSAGPMTCDITIAVDDRPGLPPNAYQTVDRNGRPYVVFTLSLIALARNADEIAFVMGHEAGHHIAGHIPRRQDEAMSGALLAGVIAQASGLSADDVQAAQDLGAEIGARRYSKTFELEADALGAEIAVLSGYDPVRGAAFFDRLGDPGDQFLGTHPPNSDRKAIVAATVQQLGAQ